MLEAVTGREYARVETDGSRSELEVEPLTSYFVGRAQRELGSRGALGLLTTATLRDLRTPGLEAQIPGRAFLGGVDGHIFLDSRRDWVLFGGLSGSSVSGSRAWRAGKEGRVVIFQRKVARSPTTAVQEGWNDAAWGRPRREVETDVVSLYERGYEGGLIFRQKQQLDLSERAVVSRPLPRRAPAA